MIANFEQDVEMKKSLRKYLFAIYYSFQQRVSIIDVTKQLYLSDFKYILANMKGFHDSEKIPRRAFLFVQSCYMLYADIANNYIVIKDFIETGSEVLYQKFLKDAERNSDVTDVIGVPAGTES